MRACASIRTPTGPAFPRDFRWERQTDCLRPRCAHHQERSMLDVILLAGGLGFFALSLAYVFGCDRL
jgi:hypothetical protein